MRIVFKIGKSLIRWNGKIPAPLPLPFIPNLTPLVLFWLLVNGRYSLFCGLPLRVGDQISNMSHLSVLYRPETHWSQTQTAMWGANTKLWTPRTCMQSHQHGQTAVWKNMRTHRYFSSTSKWSLRCRFIHNCQPPRSYTDTHHPLIPSQVTNE